MKEKVEEKRDEYIYKGNDQQVVTIAVLLMIFGLGFCHYFLGLSTSTDFSKPADMSTVEYIQQLFLFLILWTVIIFWPLGVYKDSIYNVIKKIPQVHMDQNGVMLAKSKVRIPWESLSSIKLENRLIHTGKGYRNIDMIVFKWMDSETKVSREYMINPGGDINYKKSIEQEMLEFWRQHGGGDATGHKRMYRVGLKMIYENNDKKR